MLIATEARNHDRSRWVASAGRGCALLMLAFWVSSAWAAAARTSYPKMLPIERYLMSDRASEIAMARSAAPKEISDSATILVLGKDGYETAVKGTNGFVCLIFRSWSNDYDYADFWDPKLRTPQCWNAAAANSWLPDYFMRTKWALSGASPQEMAARTKAALADHQIMPPAPGSMAYMMSKDQYINEPSPATGPARWYPHVMFFVPSTDGSPWGANAQGGPLYSTTLHSEPFTIYFLVVPKWSDGTMGPYVKAASAQDHHHHG